MPRFANAGTRDIYNGDNTSAARKTLPQALHDAAARKIDMILNAPTLNDLRFPPGNKLHPLKKDRKGQHAIWINDQYRICFTWENDEATAIEIIDYHD